VETPAPLLLAAGARLKSNYFVLAGQARALLVSRDLGRSLVTPATTLATAVAEIIELPDGRLLALGEAGVTILPKP
jgi:hypothetical protein